MFQSSSWRQAIFVWTRRNWVDQICLRQKERLMHGKFPDERHHPFRNSFSQHDSTNLVIPTLKISYSKWSLYTALINRRRLVDHPLNLPDTALSRPASFEKKSKNICSFLSEIGRASSSCSSSISDSSSPADWTTPFCFFIKNNRRTNSDSSFGLNVHGTITYWPHQGFPTAQAGKNRFISNFVIPEPGGSVARFETSLELIKSERQIERWELKKPFPSCPPGLKRKLYQVQRFQVLATKYCPIQWSLSGSLKPFHSRGSIWAVTYLEKSYVLSSSSL